ncbi:hypothetical protein AA0472_2387 [Acetobacter estunensis NRIC 0472]|nr:hypothetical protein AA0472_2387 [Acetobacter estunensis NRIC 0472]
MFFYILFMVISVLISGCSAQQDFSEKDLDVIDAQLASGATENAMYELNDLYHRYPRNYEIIMREAAANSMLQRQDAAISLYKEALSIRPESKEAWVGLARIYINKDPSRSQKILEKITAFYPNDVHVMNDYGISLDLNGKCSEAQEVYRKAISLDPTQISPEINLALSLALSGDAKTGLSVIKPYAMAQDATSKVQEDYAAVLVANGRLSEAEAILYKYIPDKKVNEHMKKLKEIWGYKNAKVIFLH